MCDDVSADLRVPSLDQELVESCRGSATQHNTGEASDRRGNQPRGEIKAVKLPPQREELNPQRIPSSQRKPRGKKLRLGTALYNAAGQ